MTLQTETGGGGEEGEGEMEQKRCETGKVPSEAEHKEDVSARGPTRFFGCS